MDEITGMVSLVGAGPGDPGLLTVKGSERMRAAEVVIYDRLASPDLLALAPPEAELIDVGKAPGRPGLGQEGINDLLVEKAREGRRVVRLKGGDPFVFGRGGEEAIACHAAGIRFEVIPGVTSAIAAPAYAGIPVTHRGISTSLTIITGHEETDEATVDWASLAALDGTLVLMMSVGSLGDICDALVSAGKAATTPVAAVEWGTHPRQRVIEGTLATIAAEAKRSELTAPAAVIVGEVALLRGEVGWFDRRPLWGRKVLVTRARSQASALAALLAEEGAEVIVHPLIAVEPVDDPAPLDEAIERIAGGGFSWVVFASTNGVEKLFAENRGDARIFAGTKVAAIGEATADSLTARGIRPDLVPDTSTSEGIVEALPLNLRGEEVLLVRAEQGREVMADGLESRGFDVTEVAAYKTVAADPSNEGGEVAAMLEAGEIDAVAFASSSTVKNFVDAFGTRAVPALVVCIGPATAATAVELGIEPTLVASDQSIKGLVASLIEGLTDGS